MDLVEKNEALVINNYLHDIKNKLTIILGHSFRLSRKHADIDFAPVITNVTRINEIVNDLYLYTDNKVNHELENYEITAVMFHLIAMAETLSAQFSIKIGTFILHDLKVNNEYIKLNLKLLLQVIENATDNSIKANSSVIDIYLLFEKGNYVIDIVDNGVGLNNHQNIKDNNSLLPHGMGTKIIWQNMKKMNANVEWAPRGGNQGTIAKLIFPIIAE